MAAKHMDFSALFTAEDRKSLPYLTERAVLEFTEDLVRRMEDAGVNRAELARRIEASPAYVTKILRGTTNFTLESMVRIARALGCQVRTHLQPEGARSQWFDLLEGARAAGSAFRNSCEMNQEFRRYAPCGGPPAKEDGDDSFAVAS